MDDKNDTVRRGHCALMRWWGVLEGSGKMRRVRTSVFVRSIPRSGYQ